MTAPSQVRSETPPEDVPPIGAGPVESQQPVQEEYWGFSGSAQGTFMFPDGVTYITYSKMNEGAKSDYERKTQNNVVLERGSGNARFSIDPSRERHELIRGAATGWNLTRGGKPTPFNDRNLRDWLTLTDPVLVERLADDIRKLNPWARGEMTLDDIDTEISRLEDLRAEIKARDEGEDSSSNK